MANMPLIIAKEFPLISIIMHDPLEEYQFEANTCTLDLATIQIEEVIKSTIGFLTFTSLFVISAFSFIIHH